MPGILLLNSFYRSLWLFDANIYGIFRRMDDTHSADRMPQDSLRHNPRSVARNIMDSDEHLLHVWIISHVSLGSRSAIRVQRWGI
jgi:hypothetical protein